MEEVIAVLWITPCLLQVVNTTQGMIYVAFIDINYRKAARAVRNRFAEHFCPQTW